MADTERTTAYFLSTAFADNSAGAITEQMVRDFVVTALGGYGGIGVLGGAVAQVLGTSPAKLTAFTADAPALGCTPAHASDQITIGSAGVYWVEFAATVGGDAAVYTARLYKNGSAEGTLAAGSSLGGSGDVRELRFAGLVSLSSSDVLTVFGEADSAAKSLTLIHAQFSVKRIG